MPTQNHFLFVEPLQHYLEYSTVVMKRIVAANKRPYHVIIELTGDDANPTKIDHAITEIDPILFVGIGHGSQVLYTVECKTPYMSVGDQRVRNMSDRIVVLNSCLTGQQLGPNLISNGATAYFGSVEEFWFYTGTPAGSDRASISVFLAELQSVVSLMEGKTVEEAQNDRINKYFEEITYWSTGDGRNHPDAALLIRCLEMDRSIAVMYGQGTSSITPPVAKMAIPTPVIVPIALGMIVTWYTTKK